MRSGTSEGLYRLRASGLAVGYPVGNVSQRASFGEQENFMPPTVRHHANLAKTLTYLVIHLGIGFTVAYLFTASVAIASGIAVVEPLCNAVAYFFHEKMWNRALA